jgi:hypothetical protein
MSLSLLIRSIKGVIIEVDIYRTAVDAALPYQNQRIQAALSSALARIAIIKSYVRSWHLAEVKAWHHAGLFYVRFIR